MQFPNPNRIIEQAFRKFLVLLAVLLAAPAVLSFLGQLPALPAFLAVSLVAAAIHSWRGRATPGPSRRRAIGRAERTPVMPIEEDDR